MLEIPERCVVLPDIFQFLRKRIAKRDTPAIVLGQTLQGLDQAIDIVIFCRLGSQRGTKNVGFVVVRGKLDRPIQRVFGLIEAPEEA